MKHFLFLLRITMLIWSVVMIMAADWQSFSTEGAYELEEVNRSAYGNICVVVLASFIADAAFERNRDK